ncbi:peptidyl-prolyl cis-trans isomerase [Oceanihabitans sp. 2_MG-2023]|uniref:peptidyl-prolyl cis-trans isomerase n=1 Tax=Oceanihabitans sp. 2_MG-2023 TaxID=3062661 RepID=UPI0026E2B455|nr:peptidyl-prolyl cis-trans isomerase [Oceanihabitans sp. 2_MG-2023]MDO6597737.1 peptidyl-prolyl cis-trans isomerase [Oceanihabitans sp. 2_MG-2023]
MKLTSYIFLISIVLFLFSCDFFKEPDDRIPVARVKDAYLYKEDIQDLISSEASKQDSIVLTNNYINGWATQQLLVQGAKLNLNETKLNQYNKLVEQYKNDLYAKGYLEALVNRDLDTVVSYQEAAAYYESNKEAFKLNEELVMFRYINLDEKMQEADAIEIAKKFRRFDAKDKKDLDSISIQFKSYSLNDSIWIKWDQIVKKIPAINLDNKDELLKKTNFIQLKDSLGLYLMQINDVLLQNSTAPLEYVKPTIDQIVINKRKLEKIRELEKDITKDAITNKKFEIYK